MELAMYMPCSQFLSQIDHLIDLDVSIYGRIIVGECSYIACDYESYLREERVAIDDNSAIEKALLSFLPPYGGGQCIYDEEAWIVGTVRRSDDRARLVLKSCRVHRDGYDDAIIEAGHTAD